MTDIPRLSPSGPFQPLVIQQLSSGSSGSPSGSPYAASPGNAITNVSGNVSNGSLGILPAAGVLAVVCDLQLVGDGALASTVTLSLKINSVIKLVRAVTVPANASVPVVLNMALGTIPVPAGSVAFEVDGVGTAGTVTVPDVRFSLKAYNQ